jgi:hypothetical protein
MLTLRCTPMLRATLRLPDPLPEPPASTGALGDWFVHLLDRKHPPVILATSQASLLTVLLPPTGLRTRLSQTLGLALGELLSRIGVPQEMGALELATMEPVLFGPARDRRVLSAMRQMAREAEDCLEQGQDLQTISLTLCYMPRPALGHSAGPMRTSVERLGDIFGISALHARPPWTGTTD